MLGADSAARFSAQAAVGAGYSIGARYVNQSFGAAELADYQQHGLILLPIYEESGRPGSYSDGQRQGDRARHILEGLGLSGYGCVFTDDVSNAPINVCRDWAKGIRSTFPFYLVYYGPNTIIDTLADERVIDSGWVEGAWGFSSGYNPRNPQPPACRHACGVQYPNQYKVGGVTVDYNTFSGAPWLPGSKQVEVLNPTAPAVITEEFCYMAATKDELKDALREVITEDEVLSAIGKKAAYWLLLAKAEGQPDAANYPDLGHLVTSWLTNNPENNTLRDELDQIYNATNAHP